ncbi:tetratricopeptide repeat protein [Rhodoferax sp.]|uniref:tetratricopeptide repeat protein n=1 Tax=Rhodoferax sp. TaxID=50421 RepID=UPI00284B5A8B|nr:tetratricopeptide repeat protein [Rhodoferax sp.]MDR3367878.1 tetratricopeptide repeat protein [Rhodoferax sp.]
MLKKVLLGVSFFVAAAFTSVSAMAAAEPTMHEVYQAAQAGRYIEAQDMMDQVLKAHPNSAKAHFAEAELLAKQGKLTPARAELVTAERLQPGLPFAKPQAVSSLKTLIESSRAPMNPVTTSPMGQQVSLTGGSAPSRGLPWGLILGGMGLLAFILFAMRFMQQRTNAPVPYYPGGFGNQGAAQPFGAGMSGGVAPMGMGGSGLGSGIMGGLATGAALGAGMVAGEALMHHFTDGGQTNAGQVLPSQTSFTDNLSNNWNLPADDMGGNDFGISDSASWDSGGGSDDSWG